ncbi:MAG: class I SAM-dependent methyltransferase [Clostridia bacterium]|nr:class I SAM-dependent methyltransferase [Clostridia bacterium]
MNRNEHMSLAERALDMQAFFDRKADGYDDVHRSFMGTKTSLTDALPDGTHRILDLGGGTGLELFPLFERFPDAQVTVIDVSEKMLDLLMKRPFANHVQPVFGDFFEVGFGTDYDAVISTSALHHFEPDDKRILWRKVYDCLRPGGLFLNADKISKNRTAEADAFAFYRENKDSGEYPHIDTPLAPSTEVQLLEDTGFHHITVTLTDRDNYRLFRGVK